jgi:hypothetical protein
VTTDPDIAVDHEEVYGIVVFDVKKKYVDLAVWGPYITEASSTHNVRIGSPDGRDQVETGLPADGIATIGDALTIEVDAVKGKQAVLTISPGVEAQQQFQIAWP